MLICVVRLVWFVLVCCVVWGIGLNVFEFELVVFYVDVVIDWGVVVGVCFVCCFVFVVGLIGYLVYVCY